MAAILAPLSQKTKVGSRSPDNGHNRPLYTVVFLCPPKTQAALCRLFSVMAGYFRQPLKRLAGSVTGTANLIYSATQRFAAMGGGYSSFNGVRTMSQNNSAHNSEQTEPKTINNLHQAFADLCYSYGMLGRNVSAERNNDALEEIITDCEALADVSMALRLQAKGGVK